MSIHHMTIAGALCLALLGAAAPASAQPAATRKAVKAPAGFPIADVIAEVKSELQAAQSQTGADKGLTLQQVELNFALSQVTDAKGNIAIGVPILGGVQAGGSGEHNANQTSTIVIDLVPPSGSGAAMSAESVKNLGLTQAIISTRQQLAQGMNQTPKLTPDKVVISLKFAVTNSGGPTGQVKFLVFTIGGGVAVSQEETSTVQLTFAKAKPLS